MRVFCVPFIVPARAPVVRARQSVAVASLATLLALVATLLGARSLHAQATPPCTREYWCGIGVYPSRALEAQENMESASPTGEIGETAPAAADASEYAAQTMVFQSFRDGNWEIYTSRLDGAGLTRLTSNRNADTDPRLNPNLQNIVFVSDRAAAGFPNLYLMNRDGSDARQITFGEGAVRPRWSPDGKYVYFTAWIMADDDKIVDYDIRRVNMASGAIEQVVGGPTFDFDATLSPDGVYLVWVRPVDAQDGVLMRSNVDGVGGVPYGPQIRYMSNPNYSDSGEFLSFEYVNESGWNSILAHQYLNMAEPDDGQNSLRGMMEGGILAENEHQEFVASGWTHGWANPSGEAISRDRLIYTTYHYSTVGDKVEVQSTIAMGYPNYYGIEEQLANLGHTPFDANADVRWNDMTPPTTAIYPLPGYSRLGGGGAVRWLVQDEGDAGVRAAQVQLSDSPCCNWSEPMERAPAAWIPVCEYQDFPGSEYPSRPYYRVRLVDGARNISAWSAPVTTQCYYGTLQTLATDVRGYPIAGARYNTGSVAPNSLATQYPSGLDGRLRALTWYNLEERYLNVVHSVYGLTPAGVFLSNGSATYYTSPAGPNLIKDGDFGERYNSSGWWWAWAVSTSDRFDGAAAAMRATDPPHPTIYVSQEIAASADWAGMINPTLTFAYRFNRVPSYEPEPAALAGGAALPLASIDAEPFVPAMAQDANASTQAQPASIEELPSASAKDPYFEVIVRETATVSSTEIITDTVVHRRTTSLTDWRIAWVDMTPWQGKAITILFALQNPDLVTTDLFAVVDRVALSPWRTPVVSAMSPSAVADAQGATLTVTSTNLIGAPKVQLLRSTGATSGTPLAADADSAATVEEITLDPASVIRNGNTLTATLPANLAPGVYNVLVINPGGDRSFAPQTLTVGKPVYLPRISQ